MSATLRVLERCTKHIAPTAPTPVVLFFGVDLVRGTHLFHCGGVQPGTFLQLGGDYQTLALQFRHRDLMDYVQLVAGTACIGKVFIEQMIIAYGCGANGKSTFWNTLARVLGTYSGKYGWGQS